MAGLIAISLGRLFNLSFPSAFDLLTEHSTNAELLTASRQMFVVLTLQYSGYFVLIIPINWWYRRRGVATYGLTKAGHTWTKLLLAWLATVALSSWLSMSITLVNWIHPSKTVAWRQAFFDMSWRRWEFWLFAGVMSWALIPVVEELFYRGYCQRRLAMSAIGFGVVFAWTRSLIPSMIAHALIDIPMTAPWEAVRVTALVIGAVFVWQRALPVIKRVFANTKVPLSLVLGVVETVYAIAAVRIDSLIYLAAGMVVIAVVLEAMDRRRDRILKPA